MITCIALYFIFKKIGIEGYKAFVPVYNYYLVFKNTYSTKKFWLLFGMSIGAAVLMLSGLGILGFAIFAPGYHSSLFAIGGLLFFLAFVPGIWAIVLSIKGQYYFARSMYESKGFGVFTIFFPLIAYIIMAFDKDYQYQSNYYQDTH